MELRLEVVSLESLIADEERLTAWKELALEAPGASYFQTPDWTVSWWETIGMRPSGSAALVWNEHRLAGCFALAHVKQRLTSRLPLRISVISNAGSGIGTDHAGWLAADGAEKVLAEWALEQSPALLKGVPLHVGELLGGQLIEVQRCPRVNVSEVPSLMSAKLAKNLRNAQKRLAREGIEFSWRPPGSVEAHDLERLYSLHRLRRSEVGDQSVFDDQRRRDFHEHLLKSGDDRGGTALMVAAREDDVLGILYGFVWQRTFAYYQIGWDPRFRQMSLGSVLVLEAIESCSQHGIEVFDFLRGAEDYKYRFGAVDVVEGTFAVGQSIGLTAIRGLHRIRGSLRGYEH